MTYQTLEPDDIIADAREFWALHAGRTPGTETRSQYAAECRRAHDTAEADLPGNQGRRYKRRAALIWAALETLEAWVDNGDVSEEELRGAVKILRAFPPSEPDTPPDGGSSIARKKRRVSGPRTKDRVAARLEAQLPSWQDSLFAAARRDGDRLDAVAVTMAAMTRPVELETGVRVCREGRLLRIDGVGGKVNEGRQQGQPSWSIWVDPQAALPEVDHLWARVEHGPVRVQCPRHALRRAIRRAARSAFGDAGVGVSPYVLRCQR